MWGWQAFDRDEEALLAGCEAALGCLDTGDATLYDSRLLHAGGANRSPLPRLLFYLTFRHVSADADALGNEAAHSLRPELRGTLTLADLRASAALEEGSGADA